MVMNLFHKYKIDGTNNQQKCQDVVPMQVGALEHDVGYDGKDGQRDALLYDLQLYEVEWASVVNKSQSVSWYLAAVLEEGDHP